MVVETRTSVQSGVVCLPLVPCAKTTGKSFENGGENSNQKTESFPVDRIRTYKRRKHSHSGSQDNIPENVKISLEAEREMNEKKECMDAILAGSCDEPNDRDDVHDINELCHRVFSDLTVSEEFKTFSYFLSDNFRGIRLDSFSDFNIINSRLGYGDYRRSPILLIKDIQQLWIKFQKIGSEMVSLAKALSDKSRTLYCEQVGGSVYGKCPEDKVEEIDQVHNGQMDSLDFDTTKQYASVESDRHSKPDQAGVSGLGKSYTCGYCGGKTDKRICIVCDSCEKIYHVYCAGVSINVNSPRSWYCKNCIGTGLESPHYNCVVCERFNDPSIRSHIGGDEIDAMKSGLLDEKSNCCMEDEYVLQQSSKSTAIYSCKRCQCEFADRQFRTCEHSLCHNRFHQRCLTDLELQHFGPRWYCPSCLCRVCLIDRDDEKVVLCDGCDNAYHIYCIEPRLSSIPEGKWFCKLCDTRIQAIRKAKKVYENLEKHQRKGTFGGLDTAIGSMDILLSAAEKLKNEEKLVQ